MKRPSFNPIITLSLSKKRYESLGVLIERFTLPMIVLIMSVISVFCFFYYLDNGLGLAYNDARSHLNIGRRVVEGLKPGLAQLGSVWLPLPHLLMVPTIWNDFMWHSGLSGALQSMFSFVLTGYLIYRILEKINVPISGRIFGVLMFVLNLNILFLQSTAMTELLLIATMTAGVYELINYHQNQSLYSLIRSAFWVMLSTLIRYDGWFLFFYSTVLIVWHAWKKKGWGKSEGIFVFFCTLAGFGIFFWLLWNTLIFKDPLYFAFGPYSAHAQQTQLDEAGVLITKGDWRISLITYWYALIFNSGTFSVLLGSIGAGLLLLDKKISIQTRIATTALLAPLLFNILALYLGHSVLFVQGLNGDTWFNVRYGITMMPSIAIYLGYLIYRLKPLRIVIIGLLLFTTFFHFTSADAVTIDDGRVGSSQKNVSEVSGWLRDNTSNEKGFILISAASHDAIIFSSGLPMKRFIHEGTGTYWESATSSPDRWARWIIMRTNDENDQTFKLVKKSGALYKYELMNSYPFADIYQLKPEYMDILQTEPTLPKQR